MNFKIKNNLFATLFLLTGSLSMQAKTDSISTYLSFDDALILSLENNLGVKQANSNAEMKQRELKEKRGLFLPTVSLAASYVHMSDDISIDMSPIKETITPLYSALGNYGVFSGVPNPDPTTNTLMPVLPDDISTAAVRTQLLEGLEQIEAADWNTVIQDQNFGFINANATLPIYAGGKVRMANKAASIYYDEAQNEAEIKKMQVIDELVERYFGLVLANEALHVREKVLETMELHMHNAQRLMEEGIIANAEYLHAKVYYSDAQREWKKAQRTVTIAREGLQNTLSNTGNLNILPITSLFICDSINSLDYFKTRAVDNSTLLKKVEYKKQLVETKHHVELGKFMPTVAAMGTYQLAEWDVSSAVPKYMVGVGLNWTIFDGTKRYQEMKASELQKEQVEFAYDNALSGIETALTKHYEEMQMYIDEYNDLETAYEFANEYYRVREKGFGQGISTATELADASLAKAKVEIDMLQAKYNFDKSLSKLLYYSGLSYEFDNYRLMSSNKTNN